MNTRLNTILLRFLVLFDFIIKPVRHHKVFHFLQNVMRGYRSN